jgi:hypothetical protein
MKYLKIGLTLLAIASIGLFAMPDSGTQFVGASGNETASIIVVLPDMNGEEGQVWQSDGQGGASWATIVTGNGTVGSAEWGGITGTLSDQTDLQSALDSKETPSGAQAKVNVHANAYGHSDIALNTANRHDHTNKSILDATQEAFTTALKTSYDWLAANITAAWKTSVDSHLSSTGNPHGVTKTQIGLWNVPNLDTTDAVNNQHTHSNKSVLDATQESFTTALKNSYNWLANNITSVWKTTVDNFIGSKGQANGLAPLGASSKVPTVNLGGAGADGTKYLRGDQTWAVPSGGGGVVYKAGTVTTDGNGEATVTFNTAMPSTDYAICLAPMSGADTVAAMYNSKSVNGFGIKTEDDSGKKEPNLDVDWIIIAYSNP